ncbi:hypothetical protein [Saccharothrix texasensis]|uniref:Peptidase inhibitor family I36 n=1 Tax=Saccharothrix texasensis TaxID=103734 RepID=A0A3N1HJN0_9PSEU|nr:hypothetical protein [Saccharothrix texasensis]ROP42699.1 hypothetical protein EDD40_8207 [Saccharothrix texasensis]
MIRRLLVGVVAALGVVALAPASAQAIPVCKSGYACLYQWYADPEHTVFNGFRSIDCDGSVDNSGVQRGYLVFGQARCNPLD